MSLPNADAAKASNLPSFIFGTKATRLSSGTPFGRVRRASGERLRLDGQLGYLTLNNAPLTAKLHEAPGRHH